MIWYQAAPGEEVTLKGSDEFEPTWERLPDAGDETGPVWRAAVANDQFPGENLQLLENLPEQSGGDWERLPSMELKRVQLFLDGEPLTQVGTDAELSQTEEAFLVQSDGGGIRLRLSGNASPVGRALELTTREQVFAPIARGLSHIGVSGFRILHAGNAVPIPPPQRGALSATAGHHWTIEDCEVAYANTVGIDIGGQWWDLPGADRQGWHILRRNWPYPLKRVQVQC